VSRAGLWTNRHEADAPASHTRAQSAASVSAEGGGTQPPTLGGGFRFSRDSVTGGGSLAMVRR
jgi:hypothetical protein